MALLDERNDLHLTSTGVGHSYNEKLPFPPPGFKVHHHGEFTAEFLMSASRQIMHSTFSLHAHSVYY